MVAQSDGRLAALCTALGCGQEEFTWPGTNSGLGFRVLGLGQAVHNWPVVALCGTGGNRCACLGYFRDRVGLEHASEGLNSRRTLLGHTFIFAFHRRPWD